MREVHVDNWSAPGEDTFHKLRSNSPAGGWFPASQDLSWTITKSNLPYADTFFSPHLKKVSIHLPGLWSNSDLPHDIPQTITLAISALPASALQRCQLLVIDMNPRGIPWADLKELLSPIVLRCGSSLTELVSRAPLSDVAINHLIQLPNLHTWLTEGPPPIFPPSSLAPVLPPLVHLTLWDSDACGWLPLFQRLERDAPAAHGSTPLSRMKGSLRSLNVENLFDPVIDASFTSTVQMFHNLISLDVASRCPDGNGDGDGQCGFELNNDNVAELTMALPQLECLVLGHPCSVNTCATTVACLLQISAYCIKLRRLEIHFNTENIIDDLKNISEDPQFQTLHLLPKCTLSFFNLYRIPLTVDGPDIETVARGMVAIFPSLGRCSGLYIIWDEVSEKLAKLQGM